MEHRDWIAGFGQLAASMSVCGRGIAVLDATETSADAVRDVAKGVASLRERRSASRGAAEVVEVVAGGALR